MEDFNIFTEILRTQDMCKLLKGTPCRGSIHLIVGGMYTGKSSELQRLIRRHVIAKDKCVIVKSFEDTRYSMEPLVVTHDGRSESAIVSTNLLDVFDKIKHYDVIGIDEGQFFEYIPQIAQILACLFNRKVIIAALNGTFEQKPFDCVSRLYPLADTITKLDAVCHYCHSTANFSKRISNDTEEKVIGGVDKYVAVCRKCFHST